MPANFDLDPQKPMFCNCSNCVANVVKSVTTLSIPVAAVEGGDDGEDGDVVQVHEDADGIAPHGLDVFKFDAMDGVPFIVPPLFPPLLFPPIRCIV